MKYIDCRLVSVKPTGISNFILKVVSNIDSPDCFYIVNSYDERLPSNQIVVKYKPFNIVDFIKFSFWLRSEGPSIYMSMFYSGSLLSFEKTKQMMVIHDLMYKFVPGFFGSKCRTFLARMYFDFIVDRSLQNCSVIFSVSDSTKKDVRKIYNRDSIVIGEGVTLNVAENKFKFRRFKESFFLYVGNSRPHKGLDEFVLGYEKYRNNGGEHSLIIVGNSKKFEVEGIRSIGYVDDLELSILYRESVGLVFPSHYEGFGLPVLDALNHETPIYCNSIPAFMEFKNSNIRYFQTKDPDSIANCLSENVRFNPDEAGRILSRFSWGKTSKILKDMLNEEN
ncbi:glycosyltransferase family 4 protein [Pseudoalteromonas xiamenensis]|uniref:Glycosyltransferase family 4 protein n=1 Tax=Pseudoalteromonas xiamenensis TaxID=882626 RepID=A0A975HLX4_9GAMM|nr:glycosyltransferase family 1 protein [Pseudoalteromonas xiamenensis]QTH72548.1 glycosyltransferase family 4 protein [Pseudoalteromonas xiamenensis]